ncbi:MAG: cryptochrome/photolyase family protein [Bacteroidia bacterium]|jgi:deoxyribodipyrimidine photolyase-related protein|nr:cryptochrome/photolyase family protein [Bacteroidia bacterium]
MILRLVLGDQLNHTHSWFSSVSDEITYVMMEVRQETDYTLHHVQKVIAFFAAMRSFAGEMRNAGHNVIYIPLDEKTNRQSIGKNLTEIISTRGITRFQYILPDEYRLDEELNKFCQSLSIPFEAFDSEHFLTQRFDLRNFFSGKKMYLMESFYRDIRRKTGYLMFNNEPLTGQWNYDHDNRSGFKPGVKKISPLEFGHNHSALHEMLKKCGVNTFGEVDPENFAWPVNRAEALKVLDYFCLNLLGQFGMWQDMMSTQNRTLYHSRLSFALNVKLISPAEVTERAIAEWEKRPDEISIAQIEGFVRQIIGWREYMRGIYWDKMPEYASLNFFSHTTQLPDWFWTGNTKMNCLKQAITQSLETAYAHHIQRLMITGNFALLSGIDPDEVDKWYLGIYIDAIEWVEITNTRGMSQFADGGIVGSKPYVSSANYIDKMSDYCKTCAYDRKKKYGAFACPFNSLYWHFYERQRNLLEKNPRIGMMYRTWDKMNPAEKEKILSQANLYLEKLNEL